MNKAAWQTVKQAGITCAICGHGDTCTVSPDHTAFKCWRDGAKVHQTQKSTRRRQQKADDYGTHQKPKAAKRTFLSAAEAIAAYAMGKPAQVWTYQDAQGDDVLAVARWNKPDGGKDIRPAGFIGTGWVMADPPGPLPLYRLHELLAADQGEIVFICEGEKATDAAVSIGLVATTSAHGSSGADKTDFGPLAGRLVAIIPDNDEPGEHYRGDVAQILTALDPPAMVRIVQLPGLPEGGDMVEYLEALDGREAEEIKAGIMAMVEAAKPVTPILPGPVLVCLKDVDAVEVQWTWPGRIPRGRLTGLVGYQGLGKSMVAIFIASTVTIGGRWPDGTECEAGDVILVTAEDGAGDTIRPRFDAHGADVAKVHLLEGVRRRDDKGRLTEAALTFGDVSAIEAALKQHPNTKLIIFDPVGSFINGKTDSYKDNEVRSLLGPIAKLAAQYNVAVLLVMHRRKGGGNHADSLAMGSTAFTALARVVWHLCRDKDDRDRRLLLPGKNNLAKDCGGLAFRIEGKPARIVWESGPVLLSADDAVSEEAGQKRGPSADVLEAAKKLLRDELSDGPKICGYDRKKPGEAEAGTIWAAVLEAEERISFRTLLRAKKELRIISSKAQFTGRWTWVLPPQTKDANQ